MKDVEIDLMYYMKNVILNALLIEKDNPERYQQLLNDPIGYIKNFWESYLEGVVASFKEEEPEQEPEVSDYIPSDDLYYILGQEVSREAIDMFKAIRQGKNVVLNEVEPLVLKPKISAAEKIKNNSLLKTTFIREKEIPGKNYFKE